MTGLFEADEFKKRRASAQMALQTRGLDALLVGTEANFVYFTGVATPSFASRTRPISLLLPADGPPTIIVAEGHVDHMLETTTVSEVRGYDGFEAKAIDVIAQAITELARGTTTIACELGNEMRLPMTYEGFRALQDRCAGWAFSDGSELIWTLRQIKSAAEIRALEEAGRIAGRAFDAMLATARRGQSQRQLYAEFAGAAAREGADHVGYFSIHNGTGADRRSNASPSDAKLDLGDMLWVDAGVVYRGYWSDFTRMAVVGRPDAQRRALYRFVYEASEELLRNVRSGVTAAQVMQRCEGFFTAAGQAIGNATRIGHGLGLDITEPPSLVGEDETVLGRGMALAVEPGIRTDLGYFVVEENFVVTDDGIHMLSPRAPADLPGLGGA